MQTKTQKSIKSTKNVRDFKQGDEVMVFLLDGTAKLDFKWQGPYVIKRDPAWWGT